MSRVLRLFNLLSNSREGMTLSEVSLALDVSKSTLLDTLRALVADGFLMTRGSQYLLGPGAFRLAATILSAWSLPDIVRHYLRDLWRTTDESVGFAIADWDIGQVIYTDAENSIQPVHYAMRIGIRAPLYASAAGRVLLAFDAGEKRDAYLARGNFKPLTEATRTTPEDIRESLRAITELGYCASFGEMLRDTAALAVPIYDAAGTTIGALMVAAPLDRMKTNFDFLLGELIRCGRQASGLPAEEEPPAP